MKERGKTWEEEFSTIANAGLSETTKVLFEELTASASADSRPWANVMLLTVFYYLPWPRRCPTNAKTCHAAPLPGTAP